MKWKQYVFLQAWLHALISLAGTPALPQRDAPDLLVSSRNTNSVKRYDGQTGVFVDDFVAPNSGGLNAPQEVLFAADGHLLVTGRGNGSILKYDGQDGSFLGNFSSGYELDEPTKMTLGPDSLLYISQWGQQQNKVARFDFLSGAFVDEFTEVGLNQACGHVWDPNGNLYVASYGSADVRKFDPGGRAMGVFAKGPLQGAVNLWFGSDGDLYVVDWTQGAVLRFDGQSGSFKSNFITGLRNAEGFAFGSDSLLYLCDWSNNQVKRYDDTGAFVDIFASSGNMRAPNSLAFFPADRPTLVRDRDPSAPDGFMLAQSYPNPFNPSTTISYHLRESAKVEIKIVNLNGQIVRILLPVQQRTAGTHRVQWDGRDDVGRAVASGIYICRLRIEAGLVGARLVLNRKMILLR